MSEKPTRYTATLDWVCNLAALGLRDQSVRILVQPSEWAQWVHETADLRKYAVEPMGFLDMQFYGPAGIIIRVSVAP